LANSFANCLKVGRLPGSAFAAFAGERFREGTLADGRRFCRGACDFALFKDRFMTMRPLWHFNQFGNDNVVVA
jgi:hypothetical protein